MKHLATTALSATLAITGALAPTALQARVAAPYFTVELAQPASEAEVIAGGVVFLCEGTRCVAPRCRDRALRVCNELRREVGTIASFNAGGSLLSESQLERCNR